jgi:segregation and condensation protein A
VPLRRSEYNVKLELFEGPLDLLLYLVNKSEVSIIDISVAQVVAQYLEYLDLMRELSIDIASEYLHMAATLIRLKARELLPPQEGDEETIEEGIYNREQLIAQLLEYKKFKEAAGTLRTFESEQYGAFVRGISEKIETVHDEQEVDLGSIGIFDLLSAFKRILERVDSGQSEQLHVVSLDTVKIDERIEVILGLLCDKKEVGFEELFLGDYRKIVVVVTFMAILELVKMQEISFRQEENFGPIFVCKKSAPVNLGPPPEKPEVPPS